MFARFLLWLVLGLAVWWILRPRRKIAPPDAASRPPAASGAAPEAMVDCASCGLHFPASEALHDGAARTFCCTAHRDAGPRRGK